MRGPIERFREWLDASIRHRLTAVLLLVTVGFLVATGLGNGVYLAYNAHRSAVETLAEATWDFEHVLSGLLVDIVEDARMLAGNPAVVSALLDTRGQESYLHPLLSRFKPHGRKPSALCVVDYRGRSLGCASPLMNSFEGQPWLTEALAADRPVAHFEAEGPDPPTLYLVQPIVYEGSEQVEGAVVLTYPVRLLVDQARGEGRPLAHVELAAGTHTLYFSGWHEGVVHAERPLEAGDAFAPLALRVIVGVDRTEFLAPVIRLVMLYVLIGVCLVAGVVWIAQRLVPSLTGRLTEITAAAERVAYGGFHEFDADRAGRDEIGKLARAFTTMTARLQETQRALERRVRERTEELHAQQQLLQSIVDAVPGVIFQLRRAADGTYALPFVSSGLEKLLGVAAESVRDDLLPLVEQVDADDREALLGSLAASAQTLMLWQQDFRIGCPGERECWIRVTALPRADAARAVVWHGVFVEITEHKCAELALADSEAYARALFRHTLTPQVIIDPATGKFIDCNRAAVEIYRLGSRDKLIGLTPIDVSAPVQYDGTPTAQAVSARLAEAQAEGVHRFEWRHRRPDGELWDGEVRLMRFRHAGRTLIQLSLRDITEQRRSQDELWRSANFDRLTGLANRNLLGDRLDRAIERARRNGQGLGVMYIDLDGFKAINDSLGHAAGDELLSGVARRLERCIRAEDTAARLGGDEFVLLVNDLAERSDLQRVAATVVERLREPFLIGAENCSVSASVGVAVFPDDATQVGELLERADEALYSSKRSGKNQYRFCA